MNAIRNDKLMGAVTETLQLLLMIPGREQTKAERDLIRALDVLAAEQLLVKFRSEIGHELEPDIGVDDF